MPCDCATGQTISVPSVWRDVYWLYIYGNPLLSLFILPSSLPYLTQLHELLQVLPEIQTTIKSARWSSHFYKISLWHHCFVILTYARQANKYFFSPRRNSPPVSQDLLFIEASRSHSDSPHSVGLLWTSDRPVAENSTWQHTTLTRHRHPCPRQDSNQQSQPPSGRRITPYAARPMGLVWLNI